MNDLQHYMLIQQRLNFYSCYVKRLLASICEDFDEASIYGSRISQVINRLMQQEDPTFLKFFNGDKTTKGVQLLHYLERAGEVIHQSKGYYSLPPVRTIRFDSGNEYNVSVLTEKISNHFGFAAVNEIKSPISLHINDYLFRPTLHDLVKQLVQNLQPMPHLVPTKIFRMKGNQLQIVEKRKKLHDGELVILQVEQMHYFAKFKNKQWSAIKLSKNYRRLLLALSHMNGFKMEVKINKLSADVLLLELDKPLPQEEQALLSLIALPDVQQNATTYAFNWRSLPDIMEILERCGVLVKEIR